MLNIMVTKNGGGVQEFDAEKFKRRLSMAFGARELDKHGKSNVDRLASLVISKLGVSVNSRDIDRIASEVASQLESTDLEFGVAATNIEVDLICKETPSTFFKAMRRASNLLCEDFFNLIMRYADVLDTMIVGERDELLSYVSLKAMRRTYLLRDEEELYERPQYMFLRVALFIHGSDMDSVLKTYDMLSTLKYMHASPTLFNAGTKNHQLSSCFILPAHPEPDDIFSTLDIASTISRGGGGIGLGFHLVPSKGSKVDGVTRAGLVPVLKVFDAAMDVIDQGVNKRPSAISAYLVPWHADILRRPLVGISIRCLSFKNAYLNILSMKRVELDQEWTLFCPSRVPHLVQLTGDDFENEYERLEQEGIGKMKVPARTLWREIIDSMIECGGPSILFKDAVNGEPE
ncbi:hypothetical protein H1R20_g13122, partial [Candolleomyces eurysporus]